MTRTAESSSATASSVARPQPVTRIVVGVDGSHGSLSALLWAFGEARARRISIHVVLAWQYHPGWDDSGLGSMFPTVYGQGGGVLPSRLPRPGLGTPGAGGLSGVDEATASVNNLLDAAISMATEADADSTSDPVRLTQASVEGHAATVLLDTVTDSDLLVVGSHGHGGFVGALLGSISHHVVSHSRCPVVVVPAAQRTART